MANKIAKKIAKIGESNPAIESTRFDYLIGAKLIRKVVNKVSKRAKTRARKRVNAFLEIINKKTKKAEVHLVDISLIPEEIVESFVS